MSATRLHNLTAICFATLYGVVGLTGQSIHYLATDASVLWAHSAHDESGGYYHVHAPDFHGHYHRHTHHGSHSHAALAVNTEDGKAEQGVSVNSPGNTHQQHACPALALVSTLKLSHSGTTFVSLILDSVIAPFSEVDHISAFEVTLCHSPRGPPLGSLA